ncbi:MAG: type I restriction endonuclease [Bacteroidota bacterium]
MEDFKVKIAQLADRVNSLKAQIQTEEATKNAFIMPFIQLLGYDVFNPLEVVPEFVADIGLKKGEKVDYAIFLNNKPILIVECKKWRDESDAHSSQLFRYFHTLDCKFALLTNGIDFRFYTDLNKVNVMDEKPFLNFKITDIKDYQIDELQKFHKSQFSEEQILNTASRLKYESEIKNILKKEFDTPTDAFLKHFVSQVYDGRATEKVMADFREIFTRSSSIFLQEYIKDRINMVFESNLPSTTSAEIPNVVNDNTIPIQAESGQANVDKVIDTTIEEIEAFYAVKSILRVKIDSKRIIMRDAQSYCSVLLDDNNRKPICRFWFNGKKKFIGLFDDTKNEVRHEVNDLDDIYKYSEDLLKTPDYYNNLKSVGDEEISVQ